MPIQPTNKDISTRGITTANLSDFSGRDRQVVIHIDDPKGYRPVIMDGQTVGGKTKVVIEKDLEEYATKTDLASKADSSALANYATKAELGSYETVANAQASYATKTELTSGLAGKADSSALASYATKSELNSYATKTELSSYATLAAPALTGNATLDGSPIATEEDIPVLTSSTTDLEAGTSPLATGTYYFVYE